ncbi:MAG: DUF1801 domain-containing protein [Anaerolineales bacterium]|nr:DUF1801 domain-containing protein [Anaerolineales bacterium]
MEQTPHKKNSEASQLISEYIAQFDDWRGRMLADIRAIIAEADPELTEAWKWSSPVWSLNGNVCSSSAFKAHVKIIFFKGAALADPKGLFNAGLDSKNMRSIDFHEGDAIDASGVAALVRAAADLDAAG